MIKPLVALGLSYDSDFARKIVNALDPRTNAEKAKSCLRITLADFVKIFKTDKVSESLINVINKETEKRAKMRQSIVKSLDSKVLTVMKSIEIPLTENSSKASYDNPLKRIST